MSSCSAHLKFLLKPPGEWWALSLDDCFQSLHTVWGNEDIELTMVLVEPVKDPNTFITSPGALFCLAEVQNPH
jgi:hypothetical protein